MKFEKNQREFFESVKSGKFGRDIFKPAENFEERVQVYTSGLVHRYRDVLSADFSGLRSLVDNWDSLCDGYRLNHPLTGFSLANLGEKFPEYIGSVFGVESLEYSMARFEWQMIVCFFNDSDGVSKEKLNWLSDPGRVRIVLSPGISVMSSFWPLIEIYQQERRLVKSELQNKILMHPCDDEVNFHYITDHEHAQLLKLGRSKSFSEFAEEFDRKPELLQSYLQNWASWQLIGDIVKINRL